MTQATVHFDSALPATLAARCAELNVPLVHVETTGRPSVRLVGRGGWLAELIIGSRLFEATIGQRVADWTDQPPTGRAEALWPGCWIVPLPIRSRRRLVGYHLAVIFGLDLLGCEQFNRIVDAAKVDVPAAATIARNEGLVGHQQVHAIAAMLHWMADDLDRLNQRNSELDELSRQLGETYEELSLVYNLSARMTVNETPTDFLEEALAELHQVVGTRWFVMQLSDSQARLDDLRGRTFLAGDTPLDTTRMSQLARRAIERLSRTDEAKIVVDVAGFGLGELAGLIDRMLIVPLVTEAGVIGVIFGAEKIDGSGLSSIDSKLVNSLAQSISIFLENSMLYDDLNDMFMGTLRSLVSAIDAKDAYTCGHSERVAWLGRELGKAAGLDDGEVERLYLSGLLHDVGKIGIPESVLAKPGKLTNEEFDIIKAHPRLGARIIEGVRQMKDLVPGVLYHHERYDGRGYPDGLAGQDIPLFGRLLCLADSFDAMSSTRTYREAMPLPKVLEEVRECAGTQFDPELAALFVQLDFEPYHRMVAEHQSRESLLVRELGGKA